MLGDKQQQKVDSNSTAMQAGRDMSVTNNYGMSVSEVKELCLLFLRDNFPSLQEEAIKSARESVQKFAVELEQKIVNQSSNIVLAKFGDPDVQAAINDAVQASARKGDKANPSVLIDLIAERVTGISTDFKDIVISEAVTVVPKMTKPQIAYLSFNHYMRSFSVQGLRSIQELEEFSKKVYGVLSFGFDLSESQKRHLEYTGSCSISSMMRISIHDLWINDLYKYLGYTQTEFFKKDLDKFAPITKKLLDAFEKNNVHGDVNLTSVGQAIALANLSRVFGKLDYSVWLN